MLKNIFIFLLILTLPLLCVGDPTAENGYSGYLAGLDFCKNGEYENALDAFNDHIQAGETSDPVWFFKALVLYKLGRYEDSFDAMNHQIEQNQFDDNSIDGIIGAVQPFMGMVGFNESDLEEFRGQISHVFDGSGSENESSQPGDLNESGILTSIDAGYEAGTEGESGKSPLHSGQIEDYFSLSILINDGDVFTTKYIENNRDLSDYLISMETEDRNFDISGGSEDLSAYWLRRGNEYTQLLDRVAVSLYDKAIAFNQTNCVAWNNKAVALTGLAQFDEALQAVDTAITLNPLYVDAWLNKCMILDDNMISFRSSREEILEEALEVVNESLQENPGNERLENMKNQILYEITGNEIYEESWDTGDESGDIAPHIPIANFNMDISSRELPLRVSFIDQSTGDIDKWIWGFDDGTISTEQNPVHEFSEPDYYEIFLVVIDTEGKISGSIYEISPILWEESPEGETSSIPAPVALFKLSPESTQIPIPVSFTDLSSGEITEWNWDFGDGASSTDQHPVHVFEQYDTYPITLTVNGPGGSATSEIFLPFHAPLPGSNPGVSGTSNGGQRQNSGSWTGTGGSTGPDSAGNPYYSSGSGSDPNNGFNPDSDSNAGYVQDPGSDSCPDVSDDSSLSGYTGSAEDIAYEALNLYYAGNLEMAKKVVLKAMSMTHHRITEQYCNIIHSGIGPDNFDTIDMDLDRPECLCYQ